MDPLIFRKGDASSCLVVDTTWDNVIAKPDFFNELAERIVEMSDAAELIGLMKKATTLRQLKNAINSVLLNPLKEPVDHHESDKQPTPGNVLVDAFWDEIEQSDEVWANLKDAIAKAYEMKNRIAEHQPLTDGSTLQDTKDEFNDAILKPLLGIEQDE